MTCSVILVGQAKILLTLKRWAVAAAVAIGGLMLISIEARQLSANTLSKNNSDMRQQNHFLISYDMYADVSIIDLHGHAA